jgi:DNA primase
VSLVDVVSEHVTLRKSGANYTGLCPFHSERSPSFSVSEQKQLFHCYGCQKGGDIVTFVKDLHSLSFSEAIEELAVRGKVQLPKEWELGLDGEKDPEAAARKKAALEKQSTAYRLNLFAARFYQESKSAPLICLNTFECGESPIPSSIAALFSGELKPPGIHSPGNWFQSKRRSN